MSYVSVDDHLVCPRVPRADYRGRPNFITVEMKQLGITVGQGSLKTRQERYRLCGDKWVVKPKDPCPRYVLGTQDYRYHQRFDRPKFRVDQSQRHGCYPYPAIRTTILVRAGTGLIDTDNLAK